MIEQIECATDCLECVLVQGPALTILWSMSPPEGCGVEPDRKVN